MTVVNSVKKLFSVSSLATILVCFYTFMSMRSIFKLMNPLHGVDIDSYPADNLIKPYWDTSTSRTKGNSGNGGGGNGENGDGNGDRMGMKIYLSTNKEFHTDFMVDEYRHKQTERHKLNDGGGDGNDDALPRKSQKHDTILLWEEATISSSSLARSFILTSNTDNTDDNTDSSKSKSKSKSFEMASKWLEDSEKKAMEDAEGGVQAVLSTATAGEGIASTSVLLTLYTSIANAMTNAFKGGANSNIDGNTSNDDDKAAMSARTSSSRIVLPISKKSSIWSRLMSNSTAHIHVVLQRHTSIASSKANAMDSFHTAHETLVRSSQSHNLLLGHVDLVKYSLPHHVPKPRRYLYLDASYVLRRYILHTKSSYLEPKPWDMASNEVSREEYRVHRAMTEGKDRGEGYPYWKPEVAIKLVRDTDVYPSQYVGSSGMQVVRLDAQKPPFNSGMAYLPGLHVDEIGLTSEKYVPVNATLDSLPLRISFDSHDGGGGHGTETRTDADSGGGGGLTPGRWRLLTHLSSTLSTQKEFGFQESDIDDIRRLVADTNVTLLAITVLASTLHLLFEFLTFKTEVEFWNGNTDLTGLSVRALFMDFVSQVVIMMFLVEEGTSLLMTIPAAFGCAIALWKCQRGAGFRLVPIAAGTTTGDDTEEEEGAPALHNRLLRTVGYELQATRLRAARRKRRSRNASAGRRTDASPAADGPLDLAALSEEMDHLATRTLGVYLLLPLVLSYTVHSILNERHSGWYSWFITSASSAVYALGFVLMTPQLFLNYKLKSVAHLPWKVLGYRFVNTFIDDLFAFIIRMPTMARISCFRDDVVFMVYLWQRHLYPVDKNRPVEGGGMDAVSAASTNAVVTAGEQNASAGDELEKKKKKKKQ